MPRVEQFQGIQWDASMAGGISAIDRQHQFLVETLDEANRHLLTERDSRHLRQVVKALLGYAIMHFETEEALMQRFDYATACPAEARDHIAQHRDFSNKVVSVQEHLREGRRVSRIEVLSFLNNWVREHVLGADKSLCNYLNQRIKQDTKPAR